MFAILFADRNGQELSPLDTHYPPALLPVGGKPVLEHTLEILRQQKVSKVFLVVNHHDENIKAYFIDGHRWSVDIDYVMSRPDEKPDEVIRRLGHTLSPPYLALRGDTWNGYVEHHDDLSSYKVLDCNQSINKLAWDQFNQPDNRHCSNLINSLSAYHTLALEAANSQQAAPSKLGVVSPLKLGIQSQCNLTNIESGRLHIGHFSRVAPSTRTKGIVVIGNDCIIDEGVKISNSIILDDTYVGPGMALNNAIVMKNTLVRVDLDIVCPVDEPFILGHSAPNNLHNSKLKEKIMACLILIALLPVWLYLLLSALIAGKKIMREENIKGSTKTLSLPDFSTPSPWQQAFPSLLAVMAGQLNLFGRHKDLARQTEDEAEPWKDEYQAIPKAWISPATLILQQDPEPMLLELTEIELYQKQHYMLHSLYLLSKYSLIKIRSWLLSNTMPLRPQ